MCGKYSRVPESAVAEDEMGKQLAGSHSPSGSCSPLESHSFVTSLLLRSCPDLLSLLPGFLSVQNGCSNPESMWHSSSTATTNWEFFWLSAQIPQAKLIVQTHPSHTSDRWWARLYIGCPWVTWPLLVQSFMAGKRRGGVIYYRWW